MIDVQVLRGCAVRGPGNLQGRIESVTLPWVRIQWSDGKTAEVDSLAYRRGADTVFEDFEILTLDKGWVSLGSLVGSKARRAQLINDLNTVVSDVGGTMGENTEDQKPLVVFRHTAKGVEKITIESDAQLHKVFNALQEQQDVEVSFQFRDAARILPKLQGVLEFEDRDGQVMTEDSFIVEAAKHNPHRRWKKLGVGPLGGSGPDQARRWKCKCSNYVCKCIGIGDNTGAKKTVKIGRAYKQRYNDVYKPWRADQEPYKPSRA